MIIKIAFFDNKLNPLELLSFFRFDSTILDFKPCFSSYIKLKKIKNGYVPLHIRDFPTSKKVVSFGTLYTIDIHENDYELLKIMYSSVDIFSLEEIKVTTIAFNSINEFLEQYFFVKERDISCLCFVGNKHSYNARALHQNRHLSCNLCKEFISTYELIDLNI
jgi:hypothetical protein